MYKKIGYFIGIVRACFFLVIKLPKFIFKLLGTFFVLIKILFNLIKMIPFYLIHKRGPINREEREEFSIYISSQFDVVRKLPAGQERAILIEKINNEMKLNDSKYYYVNSPLYKLQKKYHSYKADKEVDDLILKSVNSSDLTKAHIKIINKRKKSPVFITFFLYDLCVMLGKKAIKVYGKWRSE